MKSLNEFSNLEIKKNELSKVTGANSTTLVTEVGFANEDEYEDTNGNGEKDDNDRFLGTFNMPI